MIVRAIVKPELLRWGREDAGLSIAEAAKKVQVKVARLEGWERGELRPTVKQLRKLARIYKRPLAVFYLSEPPTTFQALRDFRRLPEARAEETPQLRLEIRKAQYRREVALSLYQALSERPPTFALSASLDDDPEELASELRRALSVDLEQQVSWKGPYPALNAWRERLEERGVLVFQMSGIDVEEARGFSLGDSPLPVVAVNAKDSPRGRIFSMVHEVAHLMIHQTGLCDLEEKRRGRPEDRRIEMFCNHLAGATLVPARDLLAEETVRTHGRGPVWSDREIVHLANRFSVSRETLLRRLVILGRASHDFYRRQRERYLEEYGERSSSGFAPVPVRALSQVGRLFARLVLDSFHQEMITSSDVSEFLGVRLKHMPEIEHEVLGRNREFGTAV